MHPVFITSNCARIQSWQLPSRELSAVLNDIAVTDSRQSQALEPERRRMLEKARRIGLERGSANEQKWSGLTARSRLEALFSSICMPQTGSLAFVAVGFVFVIRRAGMAQSALHHVRRYARLAFLRQRRNSVERQCRGREDLTGRSGPVRRVLHEFSPWRDSPLPLAHRCLPKPGSGGSVPGRLSTVRGILHRSLAYRSK